MTIPISPASTSRRHDLDSLRILAFALLILYHIGMFYVTWDWHIKSRFASPFIEPAMRLVNPWRLTLLFFISGVALRFALDQKGPLRILGSRVKRVGLPLVFGFFVVVAPQAYFELLARNEIGPGFWPFYLQYLDFDFEFSIVTPTWNHLWYLAYLLVYTPVICVLAYPFAAIEKSGPRVPPVLLLVAPVIAFLLADAMLGARFPITHALVDDWYNHAISLTAMLFGYNVAKEPRFWAAVSRSTVWAASLALMLGAVIVARTVSADVAAMMPRGAVEPVRLIYGWSVILVLLGLAQRFLNRSGPITRYLGTAILPYYILHQTFIVCLGAWATALGLELWAELAVVSLGTVLGCGVCYEIIRRTPLLRPLFGLPLEQSRHQSSTVKETVAAGH